MSALDEGSPARRTAPKPRRARLLVVLPLAVFAGLTALFMARLASGDPSRIPSALIGLPVPAFSLPPLAGRTAVGAPSAGLDTAALKAGHVTLLNVFASWCPECHDEHDLLLALSQDPHLQQLGVQLDGIVYKDKAEDARRYLGLKGDPYRAVGDDGRGRTAIDFGVYGVPETFVVKGDGTIAFKLIGPVTQDNLGLLQAEIEKAAH